MGRRGTLRATESVQMWFMLQLLAAKLFEAWVMLNERFLQSNPPDVVPRVEPSQQVSLHSGRRIDLA
jgi:hypothetical protein